jgi:hypothetical protein
VRCSSRWYVKPRHEADTCDPPLSLRLLKQLPATALWILLVVWYAKSLDPAKCAVTAQLCGYQRLDGIRPKKAMLGKSTSCG